MVAIISGTNRKNSNSFEVAVIYKNLLKEKGIESEIISLEKLPEDFAFTALYERSGSNPLFNDLTLSLFKAKKIVFIIPEYNGSFPGILKAFIDGFSYPSPLKNKKCALVGISTGMSAGTIALSHFTDILNYLGVHVLAKKIKIPDVSNVLYKEKNKEHYLNMLSRQVEEFLSF
ncbi:NAD(P)H-dependent oxidoreductase [Cytophagaceae bacterium ABcell3]|nr:NAD(P)H-dependent oxidoreductase [Cytophagaceae bacterium ABcell3]